MDSRRILRLVLLVLSVVFESGAWFLATSSLALTLEQAGRSIREVGEMFALSAALGLIGTIGAGLLALAFKPRSVAALGAAIACVGALGLFYQASVTASSCAFALGAGLFRPCPWSIAADLLTTEEDTRFVASSPRHLARVSAFVFALAATAGVSRLVASSTLQLFASAGIRFALAAVAAAYAIVCLLLLISAIDFERSESTEARTAHPYRAPAPPPESARGPTLLRNPRYAEGLFLLLIPVGLSTVAAPISNPVFMDTRPMWLFAVAPIAAVLVTIAATIYFAAAVNRRSPLVVGALGLCAVSLGALTVAGSNAEHDVTLAAVGVALSGAGTVVVSTIGLVFTSLATRGRARTLVVSAWLAVLGVGSYVSTAIISAAPRASLFVGIALVMGTVGILFSIYAARLHQTLFVPVEPPAPESVPSESIPS